MVSQVDICNLALQRLGAKSIVSLTEDSTAARECNRVYGHARDSELRAHPWSFARKRASVAASSTAPTFEYARAFPLPADFLRLIPNSGALGLTPQDDWQIENGSILTNDAAPLRLNYIYRVEDPNKFDQLFVDLLVARIARDIAEKVTQSNSKTTRAIQWYKDAQKEARRINGFERPPVDSPDSSWVTARRVSD